MVSPILSQIINVSLCAEAQGDKSKETDVATRVLGSKDAIVHHSSKRGNLSKFTHFLRDKVCTKEWREYKEAEEGLKDLVKELKNTDSITVDIENAVFYDSKRREHQGKGKEVVGDCLRDAILNMHLSSRKTKKLEELVGSIQTQLEQIPAFKEEFTQHKQFAVEIKKALALLDDPSANLLQIQTILQQMKREGQKVSIFDALPIAKELDAAIEKVEEKQKIPFETTIVVFDKEKPEEKKEVSYLEGLTAGWGKETLGFALNALGWLPRYGPLFAESSRRCELPTGWTAVASHMMGVALLSSYVVFYAKQPTTTAAIVLSIIPIAAGRVAFEVFPGIIPSKVENWLNYKNPDYRVPVNSVVSNITTRVLSPEVLYATAGHVVTVSARVLNSLL